MPVIREYRGRPVKRTRRVGDRVVITFAGARPGRPGERVVVPLAEYLRDRRAAYRPRRPGGRP